MAKIVKWSIDNMTRDVDTGAVLQADWRCTAVDEATGTESPSIGLAKFEPNPDDPGFAPYDALTEEQVVGWVKEAMGAKAVSAQEALVTKNLEEAMAPATAAGKPWEVPAEQPAPSESA